ncbi:hypothetical protein HBN50_14015 [Halobacteriovorax sp. GB3]|uniref:hypothetical protein n=1 Tax=Halobacteriovorax sp. GB3 TaxID=2719615 RepID=UPI00235F373F|nr:hypothetical protein [Halobacteriovorax sp. GB3]MDD0854224.1 hypothetical protein [Halobacteriovorax sp. GB3]
MKMLEKIAYPLVFLVAIVGVYFSWTDLPFYEGVYVREDGFVEWLTVVALLSGAFLSLYRAYILKPFRGTWFSICLVILAAILIFGAGEEISWGQRIFNIQSPEFFQTHNSQGETNIHNLIVGGKKINKIIFGTILGIFVGLYFLVLPVLYRKIEKVKTLIDSFAIPVPKVFHIVVYLILVGLVELIEGGKKGEILEFAGCWVFTLLIFAPYNRIIYSRKSFER